MNNEFEKETQVADAGAGAKAASNLFRDEFVSTMKAQGDATATGDAIKVPPYSTTEHPPTDAKPNFPNTHPPTDAKPNFPNTHPPTDAKPNFPNTHPPTDVKPNFPNTHPPTDAKPNFPNTHPPTDAKPNLPITHPSTDSAVPGKSIGDMTQRPLDSGLSDIRSAIVREQTLPTGDTMTENILSGDRTVKTKNGDKVTIDRDGNVKVDGEVKSVKVDKDGRQTYTMADGAVIVVGKDGFESVTRDKHTMSFQLISRNPLNSYPR